MVRKDKKMIKIIVAGHGNYASGMVSAAELIIGEKHQLSYVEFTKDTSPEQLRRALNDIIEDTEEKDILVLSDLVGGTPFKTGVDISRTSQKDVCVIGGTNLAMIMEAVLTVNNQQSLQQFVQSLINNSRKAIGVFEFLEDLEEDDEL